MRVDSTQSDVVFCGTQSQEIVILCGYSLVRVITRVCCSEAVVAAAVVIVIVVAIAVAAAVLRWWYDHHCLSIRCYS